ncbi:hypothetical protein B0J14DRAFT_615623 [Halenospora varia]|nr:hypothetical protein B0J14DRAFT_615623 [Halenospora varia]
MIYTNPQSYDIPALDLLTFLFDSSHTWAKDTTLLHCEAANPSIGITKSLARTLTKQVAYSLRHNYGVGADGPGKDVVVCISSGQPLLPILFYGVIAAGGVYSAASASFTAPELARQIRHGESKLVFCSEDARQVAVTAAKECGVPLSRVLVVSGKEGKWSMKSVEGKGSCLPSRGELDWERLIKREVLDESLICLLYSSGTTGIPKGVELSHTNIVAECFIPSSMARERIAGRAERGEAPWEYRTLAHLPAAHIAGVQGYFINPFYMGGCTYWMPKFDFPLFLHYNRLHRITTFFTVPPIYLLIAKSPPGAAPLGKELQHAASAKLGKGNTFITQTWGLSETTGSVTVMPWGQRDDTGSVSPVLPNMSLRLVDDNGADVKEGQPGELLVKGPVVTKGYYGNALATKDSFSNGWFCTGDIGIWKNGLPYIVDRKKELIKYKGLQVAPAELEALLLSHPKIADAAVIGVDTAATEVPRAYVVKGPGREITEEEILEFGGVVFLDVVPKSPSGKILRKDLRELAKREGEVKAKL